MGAGGGGEAARCQQCEADRRKPLRGNCPLPGALGRSSIVLSSSPAPLKPFPIGNPMQWPAEQSS